MDLAALFATTHRVMEAETLLIAARIPNQIIAAPPGHPDLCNMALQFPPDFRERVLAVAPDAQIVGVESLEFGDD